MPRHDSGRPLHLSQLGSTPHDRVTSPQIRSSHSLPLDRPRQDASRHAPVVTNRPTTYRVRRDPPLIQQPIHHPPACWSASTPFTHFIRGTQISIAQGATPTSPSRGFLVWSFFCQGVRRAANLLSFVSFFVRSQSPFLRPDPRLADVVARSSCQGWPSRQPCGMLRAYQAIP